MKVILLQNVQKVGKKFEVKEVSDGYANNFLMKNKLALVADVKNMEWLKKQLETKEKEAETELKREGDMARKLDGQEIELEVKSGNKGQLFEKVGALKIASRLKELGYSIQKNQIKLDSDIKEAGEYDVKIAFPHNLEANIKLIITNN